MKKNYVSPEIKVVKSVLERAILEMSDDWASGKKGFFDEEEDDNLKGTTSGMIVRIISGSKISQGYPSR